MRTFLIFRKNGDIPDFTGANVQKNRGIADFADTNANCNLLIIKIMSSFFFFAVEIRNVPIFVKNQECPYF